MKNEYPVIMSVVSNRELPKLNELVLSIDEHAFMVVSKLMKSEGEVLLLKKSIFNLKKPHPLNNFKICSRIINMKER